MKNLIIVLGFALCCSSMPVYSKPILACNPDNGAVRITLHKGENLPIRFANIGQDKDGIIIWKSSVDGQTRILEKTVSDFSNGVPIRRLKGRTGSDEGKFYVQWSNGQITPIDSNIFWLSSGVNITGDGELSICGYMPLSPASEHAQKTTKYTLKVTKTGAGFIMGTDTTGKIFISCGSVCKSGVLKGTRVTLRASWQSGYSFLGWGGACAGTSATRNCVITMNRAKTVTARFASSQTSTALGVCIEQISYAPYALYSCCPSTKKSDCGKQYRILSWTPGGSNYAFQACGAAWDDCGVCCYK